MYGTCQYVMVSYYQLSRVRLTYHGKLLDEPAIYNVDTAVGFTWVIVLRKCF